jgi:hypothetical protein
MQSPRNVLRTELALAHTGECVAHHRLSNPARAAGDDTTMDELGLPMFEHFVPADQIGMTAHSFALQLDALTTGSHALNAFLQAYAPTRKWIIVSDYCFDDRQKPHNGMVFSLIPHVADITSLQAAINTLAPSDMKRSRHGNVKLVHFLNEFPVFNVGLIFDKKVRLADDENEYFAAKFAALRKQLAVWKVSTPEGFAYYISLEKKLTVLENKLASNGFNRKLLRYTEIVSNVAAYLAAYMTRAGAELVTWMSDRDSILSHMTSRSRWSLAIDFATTLHHVLCAQDGKTVGKFIFPEGSEEGHLWYDPLVRIPDLVCAALVDFNLRTNLNSHLKFLPASRHLLTNSDRNLFLDLGPLGNTPDVRRIDFRQTDSPATADLGTPQVLATVHSIEGAGST